MVKKINDPCFNMHNRAGGLLEACLLLLLKESNSHGYNLMYELTQFGFDEDTINISAIYRKLRNMENQKLIISSWVDSEQGPNKRIYKITNKGIGMLDNWILHLKNRKKQINLVIEKYDILK